MRTISPLPDSGWFGFYGLPDGNYTVKVRKPGWRGPPARSFSVTNGSHEPMPLTDNFDPMRPDAYRTWVLHAPEPNVFEYHWEEDQTTAGYDYSAYVNEPHMVEFLGEPVEIIDDSSALRLERDYGVLLADGDDGRWTQEHAYRLLETMKAIPQDGRRLGRSKWTLTSKHVHDDIWIAGGGVGGDRTVLIAEAAFVNADARMVRVDGKRGAYFSRRLHHALVRFVTDQGRDSRATEKILQDRFGVTLDVARQTSYAALTARTTAEDGSRFQRFHPEEIVQLINTFEEMPAGIRKTPGLQFLIRRRDGLPHPLNPVAPAVAWVADGYIEFMEHAFSDGSVLSTHRLIIHEKAHFLWEHLFDPQLRADWTELGGWYEDATSPTGWRTTKQTEFVSAYAHLKNPNEDMAESIAYFVINPDKLRSRSIGKYEFIRDRIMQGNIYMSKIREDLTFKVYNLFPDYIFPGKIRRVDIRVEGAPDEDKTVTVEIELHAVDAVLEGAGLVDMRLYSESDTWVDIRLYPDGVWRGRGHAGTVLSRTFTLSRFLKSGHWIPSQVRVLDEHGNERLQSVNDFGWQMYVDNPSEDLTPPRYVENSASLFLTSSQHVGHDVQYLHARWQVDEDGEMRTNWPCYARINDQIDDTYSLEKYGTYDDATASCEVVFPMPPYMPSSVYTLDYITMLDQAGHRSGAYFGRPGHVLRREQVVIDEDAQRIEVKTTNPDIEPPELDLNTIRIQAVPTNSEAPNGETIVTLTYRWRDNISGLKVGSLHLRDPQGVEHYFYVYPPDRGLLFPRDDPTPWTEDSWQVALPPGSAPGTWGVSDMTLRDRAGNFRAYDFTEIVHFVVEGAS